jgi:mannose-6-phosphate isomerase-like protein (cupin superfamily)
LTVPANTKPGRLDPMLVKKLADHVVKTSPTCGVLHEILRGAECSPNIALAIDIGTTTAHFHLSFEEIYFVLDGHLDLRLFDPASGERAAVRLEPGELCVIAKGVHHQVVAASPTNRLCVITTPRFQADDEHLCSCC